MHSSAPYGFSTSPGGNSPISLFKKDAGEPKVGDSTIKNVLVVDDEQETADLLQILLTDFGFQVKVAYSAREALQILETEPEVNAIFSDIMMPGMTGLQLAAIVRQRFPDVRIILTSGYTAPAILAEHDLIQRFVAKPYQVYSIVKMLNE